jgi:DNA (cytosine-5)-methyltransferase 1
MNIKYASLFSGIGGFECGIQKAISTAECVFSCEADKYARAIYRKQFKSITSNDVRTVRGSDVPKINLVCGGPPCQDFSLAGKRCGLEGERSSLMLEFIRIIRETKPKHILIENVKGMLSSNDGWDFARIIIELEIIGYELEWQVLNSKNFGVAQHRERVYIIGHLGGFSGKKVFPIGQSYSKNSIRTEEKRLIDLQLEGSQLTSISRTIQSRYYKGYSSLYAECSGVLVDNKIRRFTPLEIERLQSFPDNFTVCGENDNGESINISDTQRYKCLGNAVTTNVITAIISKLYHN